MHVKPETFHSGIEKSLLVDLYHLKTLAQQDIWTHSPANMLYKMDLYYFMKHAV